MRKAVQLCLSATCLAIATAASAQAPGTGQALKQKTLRSLDNLEVLTASTALPTALLDAIDSNRRAVRAMSPAEFAALPPKLKDQIEIINRAAGDMKAAFQHRSEVRVIKSTGFPSANYPDVEWDFVVDAVEGAPGGDTSSQAEDGICNGTGYTPDETFSAMNGALIAEAVKDTAEQFCNQDILGENVSSVCVVTDILYFAAKGIYDNFNLCNDFVTAAEVNGSYRRLGHIHDDLGSVKADLQSAEASILQAISDHDQAMSAQLDTHDTDISAQVTTHDADIKDQVSTHDADLKSRVALHDGDIKALLATVQSGVDSNGEQLELLLSRQLEVIRLLHTPQGQRASDVPACDGGPCRWNYSRGNGNGR